jgi:hypothetical protein
MAERWTTRRDQGAWLLAALAVALTAASLLVEPHVGPGLLLALDAVLLCLAAHVGRARAIAPVRADVAVLGRARITAEAPRPRECAAGQPGHARPRAPGRPPH